MKKIFFYILLAFILNACTFKGTQQTISKSFNANEFEIISLKDNKSLNFNEFINILNQFDLVLVGEKHDELAHHLMEEKIYKALSERKKLDVILEMLSIDKQEKINQAKALNVSSNKLLKAIDWEKNWNEKLYFPLVKMIFYSKDELKAGNISRAKITEIFKNKSELEGTKSTNLKVKEKIKKIIAYNHKVDLNDTNKSKMLDDFVRVQLAKDRQMAQTLIDASNDALLFAGRYHTDKSIGVPLHLEDLKTSKSFAVVMLGIDERDKDLSQADFVILFKKNQP